MAKKPFAKLIRGGTVVFGQTVQQQDILLHGEKIEAVQLFGEILAAPSAEGKVYTGQAVIP